MKKFFAILLTLTLLMGMGTSVLAKPATQSTATLPDNSTYQFSYVLPDYVVTDKDATLGVNLKTNVKGDDGYANAYIEFSSEGPGSVNFSKDTANTYVDHGTLDKFDLVAQYNKTTNWTLNFSKDGTYDITFKLFDADDHELAAKTQEIKVTDGAFVFTVPENVYADTEITVGTKFITEQDYTDVHFAFDKASGAGDVEFRAQDADDDWYSFTNTGDLKPAGFDIDAPYSKTASYKLTFTEAGTYDIHFKLMDDDAVLFTGSQEVVVKKDASSDDEEENDDEDTDEDSNGNTHGLLNALQNHLKHGNGNPKAKAQSTQRLLELLQQRGVDTTELEAAIAELETAIANLDLDPDNFKALGKMKELEGKKFETYVDGKKVNYEDAEPILEKGRTLVPFRKLAEILGAEVSWDSAKRQISVTKDGETVVITIDKNTATVDGETVTLDVPAKLYKNRTLVPLRFIAEALDTQVDYYDGALISIKKHDK